MLNLTNVHFVPKHRSTPSFYPTGSGSRGVLFGTASPTTEPSPSFVDRDFDIGEDSNNNDVAAPDGPREVAAAQKLLSDGGAGLAAVVVTMTLAIVAGVLP